MARHVFEETTAPSSAPTDEGQHWIDTVNEVEWISTGSATVADWKPMGPSVVINAQTGTTYTLTRSDNGKVVTLSNASAITLTLPEDLTESMPQGFTCTLIQRGAGQVTVATEGTDTLESESGNTKIANQHGIATVILIDAADPHTWGLYGDLSA